MQQQGKKMNSYTRICWAMAATAWLIGCGGYAEEAVDDNEGELGTSEQAWVAYRTGVRYWGAQNTVGGEECVTGQPETTQCRFLTDGNGGAPFYTVSVSTSFPAATRTALLNTLVEVFNGSGTRIGMNSELAATSVNPAIFLSQSSGVGLIDIQPADWPTVAGTLMQNFAQVSHQLCTADLPETSSMAGKWRACSKALIGYDDPAVVALGGSTADKRRQILAHSVMKAVGHGASQVQSAGYRYRHVDPIVQGLTSYFKTSDNCMQKFFSDCTGNCLENPGPNISGTFQGC